MRICLRDVGGDAWVAGSIYVQNLAYAIAAVPPEERAGVTISVATGTPTSDAALALRSVTEEVFAPHPRERYARGLGKRTRLPLPRWAREPRGFDVVYPEEDGGGARFGWAAWIPDFQHRHLPELFSERERARRDADFARIARHAPVVVLSSGMARDDFARIYPDARAAAEVLHFASRMDDAVYEADPGPILARYAIPERFFLVSNQFWIHKDHETIARALAELAHDGRSLPAIVCTGDTSDYRHPDFFGSLQHTMSELGVIDRFRILGHIPRMDQLQLMRASIAVIQPSRFEGWSTVVEDARALGKPILLSDFPVHREQDPNGARFFPLQDAGALAQAISEAADLPAGPDPENEAAARRDTAVRVAAFGRGFLAIARRVSTG